MKKQIPIAAGLAAVLAFCYFAINACTQQPSPLTATFNQIYAEGTWGKDVTGKGTSGSGSTLEITREYRAYVEDFIKKHNIESVVDAGCGDWSFSKAIPPSAARSSPPPRATSSKRPSRRTGPFLPASIPKRTGRHSRPNGSGGARKRPEKSTLSSRTMPVLRSSAACRVRKAAPSAGTPSRRAPCAFAS